MKKFLVQLKPGIALASRGPAHKLVFEADDFEIEGEGPTTVYNFYDDAADAVASVPFENVLYITRDHNSLL